MGFFGEWSGKNIALLLGNLPMSTSEIFSVRLFIPPERNPTISGLESNGRSLELAAWLSGCQDGSNLGRAQTYRTVSLFWPPLYLWSCYLESLWFDLNRNKPFGASLVAQWLRIHLPMQGAWVRALVREDSTCHGASKPVHHNYWACALEPASHNCWAHAPQLLKPARLEPVLLNKRSHWSEKPVHLNKE